MYFICLLQLAATLAIPFWQWFLTKFGKKTAVYFGTSVRFLPQIDDVDSYVISDIAPPSGGLLNHREREPF